MTARAQERDGRRGAGTRVLHLLRSRTRRVLGLALVVALVVTVAILAPRREPPTEAASGALPFDMPSTASLRSSSKKVFVNYFTPVPRSADNRPADSDYYARNFLSPNGEGGQHAAYGGLFRDRPLPRSPIPGPDWRLEDLKSDVREAAAAGIDGFYLDILQIEGDPDQQVWETAQLMMRAAAEVDPGFEIVVMPDLAGGLRQKSAAELAAATAVLASSSSAYRLPDGRLVVMPLAAEAHSVAWWNRYRKIMRKTYGTEVALVPIFIKPEARYRSAFAAISYAMSVWGNANPLWNNPQLTTATSARGRAAAVQALGVKWVQPVRVQDERPKQGLFSESENTTNLRLTWQLARETEASWVQIPTWNDYSEGTQLAPSAQHGYTFLDINSYYLVWFKTGVAPPIVRDVVYVTHRQQAWQAKPTGQQDLLMKLRGGSPARDTVEVLTFLKAPGTVSVTVGSSTTTCQAPAGVGVCTVPLEPGHVEAVVTRGGSTVAQVTSPYAVVAKPSVQDLQYVGAGSARPPLSSLDLLTARAVSPTPRQAPRPVAGFKVRLTPDFDGYVNQHARDTSYSDSSSLASRGRPGYVSYLRFTVPASGSRRLIDARLRVTTASTKIAGSKDTHEIYVVDGQPVGRSTTWTSRPSLGTSAVGSLTGARKRGSRYVASLDSRALGGSGESTLVLAITSTGTDNLWFLSAQSASADERPLLTLTYAD